jgi:hypothetical protein
MAEYALLPNMETLVVDTNGIVMLLGQGALVVTLIEYLK